MRHPALAAVIWYVLAMVCLFVLRRKEPGLFRPYQTPAFPWLPLFVALLSLPLPERYPSLTLTPQKQKEKTQQAVLAWWLLLHGSAFQRLERWATRLFGAHALSALDLDGAQLDVALVRLFKQRARLQLDTQLAQSRARIVVSHRP